ncbi:glycoside hydrolase family 48 protein [Porcipelethomonas sp.]|uniref:glycoside hydrolase family 48 protein n=1 Tax=Porcipelethomonas sp. TaxID=2981675 RepID=UPI003EF9233B
MILKKKKAVIAAILSAALTVSAAMPAVSAAGSRTKEEAYGDSTYAQRFLSLYDDVITNGVENGYLSDQTKSQGSLGIPYHAVEELIIEAPDYGHETTSEAMSYIVWMAAMRDYISKDGSVTDADGNEVAVDASSDLAKAWKSMEVMIPTVQGNIMQTSNLSAQYSEEHEDPETYPTQQYSNNTGINPIHSKFTQVYGSDSGLYLMHWLADVDDWYGYGGNNGKFTFINTFQRGANESCWETVPHPCVEELKYGMANRGMKGIFNTDAAITPQFAYTNAPDAEDRAIQAVYAANRWGVGDDSITAKAGKMGDQLRNNMYDKYYKEIGCQNPNSPSASGRGGCHYLMSWYTSWGGALPTTGQNWVWQIGASHCHEFYQNPLAAYALLADEGLRAGMKTKEDAYTDYEESLKRQIEFYLWLQSANGPIAGGATSSWNGRYETYKYSDTTTYGTDIPTTFYKMAYQEHPVYLDPGSNHWIGNQVWAVQRLAELYYDIKTNPTTVSQSIKIAGNMSMEDALKAILDRWVEWFVGEVQLKADGSYTIPATLDWFGQPADWNGTYDPNANAGLTCTVTARGTSDLGCVSSLANSLIYYAKANGVEAEAAYKSDNTDVAAKGLYLAHELLDREWEMGRDDIGLSIEETNGSMVRLFEQDVYIPDGRNGQPTYDGTMPNGDHLVYGIKFLDLRSQYLGDNGDGTNNGASQSNGYGTSTEIDGKYYSDNRGYVNQFYNAYQSVKNGTAEEKQEAMETVKLNYHRFWHAGDIMIALGTMADLYPDVLPGSSEIEDDEDVDKTEITVEVGKTDKITATTDNATFKSNDESIATVAADGTVTGVAKGNTTVTVTFPSGKTIDVTVTVTDSVTIPTGTWDESDLLYGDVNLDDNVTSTDVVLLNKYLLSQSEYPLTDEDGGRAYEQANACYDFDDDGNAIIDLTDSSYITSKVLEVFTQDDLGPQK